jgi:ATP-dependent DNA ligase
VLEPPSGEGWIHEIKYDGYRTLIVIDRGQVRAFTRNGNDWTRAYRRVVEVCGKLACETALIDGEMVVKDEHAVALMAQDQEHGGKRIYPARHAKGVLRHATVKQLITD